MKNNRKSKMSKDILKDSSGELSSSSPYPIKGTYVAYLQADDTEDIYPDYELIRILGRGHFGTVWEATRKSDEKTVALKVVQIDKRNPTAVQDLVREVSILSKVSDPSCKPYLACIYGYKYLPDSGEFLIEMELVEGKRLDLYVKSIHDRSTLYRHLLLIMKDIVKALQYLHSNGIVHNDVKPDNIIIDKDLTPVLVDFGASCDKLSLCKLSKEQSALCCRGVKGPNLYVSPETLKTKGGYFPESDVWSLGISFYNAATNEYPYDTSDTVRKLVQAIIKGDIKKLNTSNKTLNNIVNRSLDRDPTTRITLDEISAILENI